MSGNKRWRAGAWRLGVFTGFDPETGKRIDAFATVRAPSNRAGAKLADAKLAEMVAAVGLLDVAVRQAVAQVPAHGEPDDVRREPEPLERPRVQRGIRPTTLHSATLADPRPISQRNGPLPMPGSG